MNTAEPGATEFFANLSVFHVVIVAVVLTVLRIIFLKIHEAAAFNKQSSSGWPRYIAETLESLIVAGMLVFLIIRPFFVQAFYIPSESMEPTLMGHTENKNGVTETINDRIFVNKFRYRFQNPQRGDIIVFLAPERADAESAFFNRPPKRNILIKRLIGIPGDTIEVRPEKSVLNSSPGEQSVVYRNGQRLNEPYIKEPITAVQSENAIFATRTPLKLGPDELFVMGDNRNNSNDSRFWGTVKLDWVIGKADLVFWPINRIHILH